MTVEHVELAIIIVQLQRVSPTLAWLRSGVSKLLAHFGLDKDPPPATSRNTAPASTSST